MNCVDGTLLFMTLFKIIGAKPVYISVPGHAMPGILLSVDDEVVAKTSYNKYVVETVYKGNKLRILPIESTMVCNSAGASRFVDAIQRASEKMAESSSRITVPSLDNIPVMFRRPSEVVFRWHRSSTRAVVASTRSRFSVCWLWSTPGSSEFQSWISKSMPNPCRWATSRK